MRKLSTKEIADLFNVTPRTVNAWHAMGCPKSGVNSFDAKAVFDWWWENIAEERAAAKSGDESINEAKRKYWWSKASNETLKADQLKGNLVAWPDIEKEWTARVIAVTAGMESMSDRLPPLLFGKPLNSVQDVIRAEIGELVKNYARPGKYTPLPGKKESQI
ncbi:MAG: hypothetical protein JW920_07695 [Deltaproteobacteria bacterium]|nr:hypothetical protein [Deltaproteobacteria bacterium]